MVYTLIKNCRGEKHGADTDHRSSSGMFSDHCKRPRLHLRLYRLPIILIVNQGFYMNIGQIWAALDKGLVVNYGNTSYKIYIEKVCTTSGSTRDYQSVHFSVRNGELLSIRCISNYFGGLINESQLAECFIVE